MKSIRSRSKIDIKDMIRCANEFHIIYKNDKTFIPNFVNLAFACELYMKSILFYYTGDFPNGHDLKALYNKTSKVFDEPEFLNIFIEEMRKCLKNISVTGAKQALLESICENKNMFNDWRYIFEKNVKKPFSASGFMFEFAESLHRYVNDFMRKTSERGV